MRNQYPGETKWQAVSARKRKTVVITNRHARGPWYGRETKGRYFHAAARDTVLENQGNRGLPDLLIQWDSTFS